MLESTGKLHELYPFYSPVQVAPHITPAHGEERFGIIEGVLAPHSPSLPSTRRLFFFRFLTAVDPDEDNRFVIEVFSHKRFHTTDPISI